MDRVSLRTWCDQQHRVLKSECPTKGGDVNAEMVAVLNQAHCTHAGFRWFGSYDKEADRLHVIAALGIIVLDAWDHLTYLTMALAGAEDLSLWYGVLDAPGTSAPMTAIPVTCQNLDLLGASLHAMALRPAFPLDEPNAPVLTPKWEETLAVLRNRAGLANPGRLAEPTAKKMALCKLRAFAILRAGFHSLQVA